MISGTYAKGKSQLIFHINRYHIANLFNFQLYVKKSTPNGVNLITNGADSLLISYGIINDLYVLDFSLGTQSGPEKTG